MTSRYIQEGIPTHSPQVSGKEKVEESNYFPSSIAGNLKQGKQNEQYLIHEKCKLLASVRLVCVFRNRLARSQIYFLKIYTLAGSSSFLWQKLERKTAELPLINVPVDHSLPEVSPKEYCPSSRHVPTTINCPRYFGSRYGESGHKQLSQIWKNTDLFFKIKFIYLKFKDFLNSQNSFFQLKGHRIELRAIWHYSYSVTVGNFGVKTKLN